MQEKSGPNLPINWDQLHQISDQNEEFELELLHVFVENAQVHLMALETAIENNDFNNLEQEAHHIKGASANVGLITMQATADQLEQQARCQQLLDSSALLAELQRSLAYVQAFLADKKL